MLLLLHHVSGLGGAVGVTRLHWTGIVGGDGAGRAGRPGWGPQASPFAAPARVVGPWQEGEAGPGLWS